MTTQITIVGNLTGDPELRFTPSGKAVANLTVAVNERVKDQTTGEWKDGEGTFYNVSVWGDTAENVAESLQRGMRVVVSGGLKGRSYERQDGSKGLSLDLTVNNDGAIGPDLKWATAKVTRTTKSGNSGGNNHSGDYANAGAPQGGYTPPSADPWATGGGNDEPPF